MKGCEGLILYADVLFAINFSMDFLALFICSMIMHARTSKKRIIISSAIGGMFGLLDIILPINHILGVIISLLVGFIMCAIAYIEKNKKRLVVLYIMFWAVSAGLGGLMSLTYTLFNKLFSEIIVKYSPGNAYNSARFLIILSITAIVSIIFSRIFSSKKDVKSAEIEIKLDNNKFKIVALCDSGNMLTDPILAKPVILVSEKSKIGDVIKKKDDYKKRIIPYKDVSGGGILKGVIPDEVKVQNKTVDAIIAPINNKNFAGYEALVPAKLI